MGGKGSGGARVGAGRKSKADHERWLGGNAGKRGGPRPGDPPREVTLIPAPRHLPAAVKTIWNELAPLACAEETLVAATTEAFAQLCTNIRRLRQMQRTLDSDDLMIAGEFGKRAHDLLTRIPTWQTRVDAAMLRFRLAPFGKALVQPEKPKDGFEEFDAPTPPAVN